MVVKHHQNRHKIHRRCAFIHSNHNWKYFCEPTFIFVHIGQDVIIVLNFILSLTLYGSESPLEVNFYMYISIHNKKNGNKALKPSKINGFSVFKKLHILIFWLFSYFLFAILIVFLLNIHYNISYFLIIFLIISYNSHIL